MGVSDGQSVTVNCTAVSNPPSTFTFFHNNSIILKNSASGVLTIPSFSRNDSGNYSCMAVNEVSNATVDGVWFLYVEPISSKYKDMFAIFYILCNTRILDSFGVFLEYLLVAKLFEKCSITGIFCIVFKELSLSSRHW